MTRKLTTKLTAILSTALIRVIDSAQELAEDMQSQGVKMNLDWVDSPIWKERREAVYQAALRDLVRAVECEIRRETAGIVKGVEGE
jgi:hypothetical protein